jgi:hypothetical protein
MYRPHLQGQESAEQETRVQQVTDLKMEVIRSPKHWLSYGLHDAISQMTIFTLIFHVIVTKLSVHMWMLCGYVAKAGSNYPQGMVLRLVTNQQPHYRMILPYYEILHTISKLWALVSMIRNPYGP